jgi:hypothetical protein
MARPNNEYFVQPPCSTARLKDTGFQEGIKAKWQVRPKSAHLHNNLATDGLYYNTEKKSFIFGGKFDWRNPSLLSPYQVIASSLVVYRLMCLFHKPPVVPKEPYKSLWEYRLQHRETKEYLTLLEYKAGFTINARHSSASALPESFAFDMLELLNFLVSDQIAHPYDGTLAGCVA